MLQKYTFTMTCLEPGKVRGLGGSELHGLFFNLLKEIDPLQASRIHDMVEKPFALEVPAGLWERNRELSCSLPGEKYSFSISGLSEEMVQTIGKLASVWQGRKISLGTGVFAGGEVCQEHTVERSYQSILALPRLPSEFTLEFRTPTSFRQQGTQIMFPVPEKVFGSLFRRWNAFSPLKLPEEMDFSFVRVKRYNLHTEMVHFEKYMVAGFTGRCTYTLPAKYDDFAVNIVHSLARFSPYAGVGYKVTMGLGSTGLKM